MIFDSIAMQRMPVSWDDPFCRLAELPRRSAAPSALSDARASLEDWERFREIGRRSDQGEWLSRVADIAEIVAANPSYAPLIAHYRGVHLSA